MTALPRPCSTCGQGRQMSRAELSKWINDKVDRLGQGWTEIAYELNDAKIPTLSGGEIWYASTVKSIYDRPKVSRRGGDRWSHKSAS